MFCPNCGTQVEDGAPFCPKCGAQMSAGGAAPQPPQSEQQFAPQPQPPQQPYAQPQFDAAQQAPQQWQQGAQQPDQPPQPQWQQGAQPPYGQAQPQQQWQQGAQQPYGGQPQQQWQQGAQQPYGGQPQQQWQQGQPGYGPQGNGQQKMSIRTASLLCYWFSFIGWIISYTMSDNTNPYLKFHLNQSLVLWVASLVMLIISRIPLIGIIGSILSLGLFVLWLIAFIGAYKGEAKYAPLLDKIPPILK